MKCFCTNWSMLMLLPLNIWFFRFSFHPIFLKFFSSCHIGNNSKNFSLCYTEIKWYRGKCGRHYPTHGEYDLHKPFNLLKIQFLHPWNTSWAVSHLLTSSTVKEFWPFSQCFLIEAKRCIINIMNRFPRSLRNPLFRWCGRLILVNISLSSICLKKISLLLIWSRVAEYFSKPWSFFWAVFSLMILKW